MVVVLLLVVVLVLVAVVASSSAARDLKQREVAEDLRRKVEAARLHERAAALAVRFGPEISDKIMRRQIWQGQTEEMLLESRGAPADVDEKVLKTKVKRTYKYDRQGANRYGLRVMLENGVVVGSEDKR